MEIKYKRTYSPAKGKRYTVGEINAMLGYAMEIADPRIKLKEGKLAPGEVCLLLFGLTPEEYALKDGDPKALDNLADRLLKAVPADRLMGWRIMDLKGANIQKAVQVQTGESIDSGEFIRQRRAKAAQAQAGPIDDPLKEALRLQKLCADKNASDELKQEWKTARQNLAAALMALEKTWVAYDALTGDRWPSIGFDGHVEIFTTPERAQRLQAQLNAAQAGMQVWNLRQLNRDELHTLLTTCAGDGLELLRIDNGFAAAQLTVKDCVVFGLEPNAPLRSMMLREIQYGMRYNKLREIKAPEKNIRGALESMLTLRGFAWREIGNATLWAVCSTANRDQLVVLSGKDNPQKLLAVFTTAKRAQAFAQKLNPTIKPMELNFDDLVAKSANAEGMLIDFGFIGYRLMKTDYDKVLETRSKPPVIVRVQPKPEEKKTEPAQMSSLPDPDEFAPAKPQAAAQPAPEPEKPDDPEPTPPPRKGILKKLFGK